MPNRLGKKDAVLCGLLGIFCLYLFWNIVIDGHRLIGRDFIGFYLAMKKFLFDQLQLYHTIPFWNPFIFGGMPFWAHFESTIFYPLGFLFWLIPPDRAYGYSVFIHFVLAAMFMYALCRSLAISRRGSFAAGLIFVCNGFIMPLLYLGHMGPVQSYIWLPIILYFVNRAIKSPTPYFAAAIAGTLWGIQILAGAPQDAFYTFLAAMLFLVWSTLTAPRERSHYLRMAITALVLFAAGAGLAAIQIVPAFELIRESVRTSLDSYHMGTIASYPPEGLITTILPRFFGDYTQNTFWVRDVPWSVPHQNLYVGILPLLLLCFIPFRKDQHKRILFFALSLAAIALILALGRNTPVYKLVYHLPGFDRFRAPSKIIVLWVFAMALLTGKGIDGLFETERTGHKGKLVVLVCLGMVLTALACVFYVERSLILAVFSPFIPAKAIPEKMALATHLIGSGFQRFTLIFGLAVLIVLLWVRGALRTWICGPLLCLLLMADLSSVNRNAVQHDERIYWSIERIRHALDASIGKDKSLYRVGSFRNSFGPNLEMYLGYQTIGGFTALFPSRFYEYFKAYAGHGLPEGAVCLYYGVDKHHVFMDLLNVKYEISHRTRSCALRSTYLPRAFIVPKAEVIDKGEILERMTRADFDPTHTVLLERKASLPHAGVKGPPKDFSPGYARIVSYSPDRLTLETRTPQPGYLFLSEVFYPGWKAFLDQHPIPILRGNYLFRVIALPPGEHRITFLLDPLSIKLGIGITGLTLFMLLLTAVYAFLRKGRPQDQP